MRNVFIFLTLLLFAGCAPRAATKTVSSTFSAQADPAPALPPRPVPPEFEEMVTRVNEVRKSGYDCGETGSFGPTVPLAWNPVLAEAAADHSRDMAENGFFSHTGSDGSDVSDRVERHGYEWSAVGENLADATPGHFTPRSVVEAWLGSPGHCANIMQPDFREIGAAQATGDLEYWTQVFGTTR